MGKSKSDTCKTRVWHKLFKTAFGNGFECTGKNARFPHQKYGYMGEHAIKRIYGYAGMV